jgi:hypothetical protein
MAASAAPTASWYAHREVDGGAGGAKFFQVAPGGKGRALAAQ